MKNEFISVNEEKITLNPDDEFLDPFNEIPQKNKPARQQKGLEPFEKTVIHSLLQIGEIILMSLLFAVIVRAVFFEILADSLFIITPVNVITDIMLTGSIIFYIIFITGTIKRAKKQDKNLNIRNLTMITSYTAAAAGIISASYMDNVPHKLIFALLLAAAVIGLIFIIRFFEREEKIISFAYLAIITVILIFFLTMRVFAAGDIYNEKDFQSELFCLQSHSVDNIDKSVHSEQLDLMEKTNEYMMYYFSDSAYPDHVFHDKQDVKDFFEQHRSRLHKEYKDQPEVIEMEKHMYELISPSFEKFDDEYFKNNDAVIISFINYNDISNIELDHIFYRPSQDTINFHTNVRYSDTDNMENTGIIFAVISVPKQYGSYFNTDKHRYPETVVG